jgi:hypothetical protein
VEIVILLELEKLMLRLDVELSREGEELLEIDAEQVLERDAEMDAVAVACSEAEASYFRPSIYPCAARIYQSAAITEDLETLPVPKQRLKGATRGRIFLPATPTGDYSPISSSFLTNEQSC